MALFTYLIAFGHFTSEVFIFHTASINTATLGPFIVSSTSYPYLFSSACDKRLHVSSHIVSLDDQAVRLLRLHLDPSANTILLCLSRSLAYSFNALACSIKLLLTLGNGNGTWTGPMANNANSKRGICSFRIASHPTDGSCCSANQPMSPYHAGQPHDVPTSALGPPRRHVSIWRKSYTLNALSVPNHLVCEALRLNISYESPFRVLLCARRQGLACFPRLRAERTHVCAAVERIWVPCSDRFTYCTR